MEKKLGTIRIAPNVLATIAKLTALSVPGVVRVGSSSRFLGRQWISEGVRIEVADDAVSVDLHVVVEHGKNILDLSRAVQLQVTRAINDMVGMPVKEVNVQILDVEKRR